MIRKITTIVCMALFAGIATAPAQALECAVSGNSIANVFYDGSQIRVPNSNVKQGTKLRFKLHTDAEYENANVTIMGSTADGAWLSVSGSYTGSGDGHELEICVPKTQETKTYKFFVMVDGLGYIDPRVSVDP